MRSNNLRIVVPITALFVLVGLSQHAHAYVDPGSGSYMLQLLAAGLFGMIFAAKNLLYKVRAFLTQRQEHKGRS